MVKLGKRKRSATKPTRRTRRRRRSSRKVPKSIRKLVRSEIHRSQENNLIAESTLGQGIPVHNPANPDPDARIPFSRKMILNVSSGTANHNRIGNKIQLRKCFLQGFIRFNQVNNHSCYVRWALVRFKPCVKQTLDSGDFSKLLSRGTTTSGLNGDMSDIFLPINREKFQVYAQRVLYFGSYDKTTASTGDHFQRKFMASITKHAKRPIQYQDQAEFFPDESKTRQIHFIAWSAFATGAVPTNSLLKVTGAFINFEHRMIWENM